MPHFERSGLPRSEHWRSYLYLGEQQADDYLPLPGSLTARPRKEALGTAFNFGLQERLGQAKLNLAEKVGLIEKVNQMIKTMKICAAIFAAMFIGSLALASVADARGRSGSHRVGGYTSHGRGAITSADTKGVSL